MAKKSYYICDSCGEFVDELGVVPVVVTLDSYMDAAGDTDHRIADVDLCTRCASLAVEYLLSKRTLKERQLWLEAHTKAAEPRRE